MDPRGLSAAEVLEAVDAGAGKDMAARGRVLFAAGAPELPDELLDEFSLGSRDASILALRCATFGDVLAARVACPACGLRLSVKVPRSVVTVPRPGPASPPPATIRIEDGRFVVEARLVDGRILASAAACPDTTTARAALVTGCICSALEDGRPVDPLDLDEAVVARIGDALVAADPQAEVTVTMSCAGCGAEWSALLDIVDFFWREIAALSVQLLDDVHELALGYGWSEEQVLRLSSRRRREYVERLAGD